MQAVEPRALVADARATSGSSRPRASTGLCWSSRTRRCSSTTRSRRRTPRRPSCLIVFTSGTSGEPKPIRHGHGYLAGQAVQAEHWYGARPGELCWCTAAAAGRSRPATPSLPPGCAAPRRCCTMRASTRRSGAELLERERVDVLCMSVTEYRVIAASPELRPLGRPPRLRRRRALNLEVVRAWERRGPPDPRRLRPDRDRPPDRHADRPAGSARVDGPPRAASAPGSTTASWSPRHRAQAFFIDGPRHRPWRTGDRVREDEDGYLWFEAGPTT